MAGVKRREIADLAAELSDDQLREAREVFSLFDKDGKPAARTNCCAASTLPAPDIVHDTTPAAATIGKGEIGQKELHFALARLGQHADREEVNAMIAKFDENGSGTIDFQEFLQIMAMFGWDGVSLSDEDMADLRMSFYGQASICRWLSDATGTGSGDVTGDDVGSITRICRQIVMSRQKEVFIYACILVAAVVSGMQSYKIDSPYEHASWAIAVDAVILCAFTLEIRECTLASMRIGVACIARLTLLSWASMV